MWEGEGQFYVGYHRTMDRATIVISQTLGLATMSSLAAYTCNECKALSGEQRCERETTKKIYTYIF